MLVTGTLPEVQPSTIAIVRTPAARRRWRRASDIAVGPAVVHFTWDNRCPGTAGFARWTAFVGQRIDEHGLAAAAREVDTLVAVARRLGIASVAVDVLADDTQAEPARCRAFAHTVSALTRPACPVST
jgi:hypothetical protein